MFQTGLESQGWHTCTFLQFTLDKCYNKILQFFYFLHKIRFLFRIWQWKVQNIFLTVFFLLYVLCRFVRKQNICLCLFMLLLSEKIYHLERESDNTFLCSSAVAPPLLGTAPNPQKRVGGSGCHCNRLYQVTHNLHKVTAKKPQFKIALTAQIVFLKVAWGQKCYQTGNVFKGQK